MTELFEKYQLGMLSDLERQKFEDQMTSDPDLAEDYKAYLLVSDHLASSQEITNSLSVLDEVYNHNKNKVVSINRRTWVGIAASLIILACATYFFTQQESILNPQEAFAENYAKPSIPFTTKGGNEEVLFSIEQLYQKNQFAELITYIDQNENALPNDHRLDLAKAISYLEINDYAKSMSTLAKLADSENFKNEYLWYSGLTLLAQNKPEESSLYLNQLPRNSNYYKKAQSILSNL